MTMIDDTRAQAASQADLLRETAAKRFDEIRNNRDLSDDKKVRSMAKTYSDMVAAIEKIKADRDGGAAARKSTLERKLFGLPTAADPSTVVSYRDAVDRAEQLDPADEDAAIALMRRASTLGDDTLSRAVLATAFDRQQVDVLNTYSEDNPTAAADIEELWTLKVQTVNLSDGWLFAIPKPAELMRYSEYAIADLVASESA